MDKLFIDQLQLLAVIGIYPWEQAILQPLLIDLQLGLDLQPAARQKELEQSVDYDKIVAIVTDCLQKQHFLLIEQVAEAIAERLLTQFHLSEVTLTVTKPSALALAESAGVTITRCPAQINGITSCSLE